MQRHDIRKGKSMIQENTKENKNEKGKEKA